MALPNNGWWGGLYYANYYGNDYYPDAPTADIITKSTTKGGRGIPSRIIQNGLRVSKQGINSFRSSKQGRNRMR